MNESTGTTATTEAPVGAPAYSISFDGILPVPSDPGLVFGQEITGTFRARIDGVNLRRDWKGNPGYTARVSVLGFEPGEVVQSAPARLSRTGRAGAALRRFGRTPLGAGIACSGASAVLCASLLLAARFTG